MLEALLGRVSNPAALAELAKGNWGERSRNCKRRVRARAPRRLCSPSYSPTSDALDETVANLDARIGEVADPDAELIALLCTIPGVGRNIAQVLIAECGVDMSVFGSAEHRVS